MASETRDNTNRNTDERLLINYLKRERVDHLKLLWEEFGGENLRGMRKKDCVETLTPILLNYIYSKRHEPIVNCFSVHLEDIPNLKRMIPRIYSKNTEISEENLRGLKRIFFPNKYYFSIQISGADITNIKRFYNYLFVVISIQIITGRWFIPSSGELYFEIYLMTRIKFVGFPFIISRETISTRRGRECPDIYKWFKNELERLVTILPEIFGAEDEEIQFRKETTQEIAQQFRDEEDEEISEETQVVSCKVCLENLPKVVFSCGHCSCISCANKLNKCHICRKTISKKTRLFL